MARQQDLADLVAGGRSGTISEWETDAKSPSYEKLVDLIRVLGCDGHWLMTGEGEMWPVDPNQAAQDLAKIRRILRGD